MHPPLQVQIVGRGRGSGPLLEAATSKRRGRGANCKRRRRLKGPHKRNLRGAGEWQSVSMGQPVSIMATGPAQQTAATSTVPQTTASGSTSGSGATNTNQRTAARVSALPPNYLPLCENVKAGDPGAGVATNDDVKDALNKILEFGPSLQFLPKDGASVAGASTIPANLDHQLQEILSSADTANELFQYVSSLASLSPESGGGAQDGTGNGFDGRVAAYVKSLQGLYQTTKREKLRYEQRQQATRTQATSQRKVTPPPLPLPTQNCMTMGWEIVVHLLKATRVENPAQYLQALQMIKDNLLSLKPTTYADSMYMAPSAAASFNALSDCLTILAKPMNDKDGTSEANLGATTVETLAEVALARGSLASLLSVVLWLVDQTPTTPVDLGVSLSKLAAIKEQQLYGKCEASGELYCCGQNSYGELGIGDDIERHQLTSVSLCGWDDIRQVVSGNEVLAILTNGGVVLTCGLNKSGQCGHGHFDERVMLLRPVQALRSQKIKFVAASNGCEHMIALTETGLAYSWGYNDRGQLGHENLTTKIHLPKLIESLKDKKIGFAAVSYHHSAVITEGGELYTFGMNDCGQLGLDHTQHTTTPQHVKALEGQEISMVACGLYHTIVCTATGELFSFGKNDYGQLGLGHSRQVKLPTLVPLPSEMVCFVACGYYHSAVVTTTGHTYSFGRNDYGQLGIGSKIHQNVPTVVALSANTRMTRATCGCYHTVLLSEQGQVYVFGRNNKGQLGNRGSADSLLPVPLKVRPEKNSRRCIDVAAGFYTTSLIYERRKENDEADGLVLDHSCLVSVCGRVDIDRSGEIEGLSNFGSVSTIGIALFEGKWFYEVEVVSSGLIQIGWIDNYFQGSSDQGEGVGDHTHSWSYDGNRQRRWNSGSSSYGEKWKAGDVIGCLLDLDSSEMTYYRNGINLGVAFTDIKCNPLDPRSGLMPGISLERGEIIRVNLGHHPFAYPPTNVGEFDAIFKAMSAPTCGASLKPVVEQRTEHCPPMMDGVATVTIKNKVFSIGGSPCETADATASNQVWVYHLDTKKWERWSDFPIGIRHHQAVAIDDDTILVIGGESTTPTSRHMDLYKCSASQGADGSLPVWELVQGAIGAASTLPAPRAYHIAASIRVRLDGMIFVYGGKSADNETLGDVWLLSLEDFSWSRLPNSISLDPGPRTGCSYAVIGENVFVFGGQDKEEKFRADLWRYNTFDRVWHLCHDDNITGVREHILEASTTEHALKNDFAPIVPEARVNYSLCADFGNIWLFGGTSVSGSVLSDLWCYSVTAQKWSSVDVCSEEEVYGCSSASLVVPMGTPTALSASFPDVTVAGKSSSKMVLVGGWVGTGASNALLARVREFMPSDTSRAFVVDPGKSIATAGKSSIILGTLRAKCTPGTSRTSQQCIPVALDSAVCLLSHLDRLGGGDIPSDDTDSIQLSRCSYRSLCVDPKHQTFEALHHLLAKLSPALDQGLASAGASDLGVGSPLVLNVLYPILVAIRLLKLNFFELTRSSIEPAEVGLLPASNLPGGTLFMLRECLFKIAENTAAAQLTGELSWFYRAVKQETAATIFHGFSIMFPSLLDRIEVMNRLMEGSSDSYETKKLLVPMLVPCFTSPKMLFQLMGEANALESSSNIATEAPALLAQFATTLLAALWSQTKDIVESWNLGEDEAHVIRKLAELDSGSEFKCLNVLVRASVYWCSISTERGWPVISCISSRLVTYLNQLLGRDGDMFHRKILHSSHVLENTFAVKLLPFILISVGSLPSVRLNFPSLFETFWLCLQGLLLQVHSVLTKMDPGEPNRYGSLGSNKTESGTSSKTANFTISDVYSDTRISSELGSLLRLSASATIPYDDLIRAIWRKIVFADGTRLRRITETSCLAKPGEILSLTLPADLAKLLGSSELRVVTTRELEVPTDTSRTRLLDPACVSFAPSLMILSQHVQFTSKPLTAAPVSECCTPPSASRRASVAYLPSETSAGISWLRDLHKILIWLGSHFAAALVIGELPDSDAVPLDQRWLQSQLLRGGLDQNQLTARSTPSTRNLADVEKDCRNSVLLEQIVAGIGAGKRLVDKVKSALELGTSAGVGGSNPKLMAARLKRQDSVEAALEKSGSIEAVDKAVRVAFAVILKHSNNAYTNGGVSEDGQPTEAVVDAWRSALQLRRWIVREQQKLASEHSATDNYTDSSLKERQISLYSTVCEPAIQRGLLLLRVAAVPSTCNSSLAKPLKLLPGLSTTNFYEIPKQHQSDEPTTEANLGSQQLEQMKLMKTQDTLDEEDERIQADIFAFLQHKSQARGPSSDVDQSPISKELVQRVLSELMAHERRGQQRLSGLQIFAQLFACASTNPSCRMSIIPAFSTAFKRLVRRGIPIDETAVVEKVHFLENLEFAGLDLSQKIRDEFFALLIKLLEVATDHVREVRRLIDRGGSSISRTKLSSSRVHEIVHEVMQVFEACSIPYCGNDWVQIQQIDFLPLVTELSSWRSWKATLQLEFSEEHYTDKSACGKLPIIPAGMGHRCPKIICPRAITIGTDLHQLTLSSTEGGLAVFHHPFYRGRWYWEIAVVSQGDDPIFVGVATCTDDLNVGFVENASNGILIFKETFGRSLDAAVNAMHCRIGCTIGVVLDCDDKKLEFFVDEKLVKVFTLDARMLLSNGVSNLGLFPAVGIQNAEVFWNLVAHVPEKLWASSVGFRFSTPIVSGCLVASPIDGTTLSLDAKTKGKRLRITQDGTTVIAGDSSSIEERMETVTANQSFESDSLFAEIQLISPGRGGRYELSFSIVSSGDSYPCVGDVRPGVDVRSVWPDDMPMWGTFGILFDFSKAKITVYPNAGAPQIRSVDLGTQSRPLLPAISVLCNGAVFRVNFHPHHRPELSSNFIRPISICENSLVSSSNDIQIGKLLQMQVLSCDGGEFSSSHTARNALQDDTSVFSSAKGRNVNLILRHEVDTPFWVNYVTIRGPGPGYSSPLHHAAIFVTSSLPDLRRLQHYDDLTPEEFASLPFPAASIRSDRHEYIPVAYCVLDGSCAQVAKQLAFPVQGRYIVVKLLCPAAGSNIDLGYVGFSGSFDKENGPAYADKAVTSVVCEECKRSPIHGVYYSLRDDDSLKLCPACYDDNRGFLDVPYFAHVDVGTDGQNDDGFALCIPRRVAVERLSQQHASSKRPRTGVSVVSSDPSTLSAGSVLGGRSSKPDRSLMWYDDCELFSCGQNNYGELCLGHCNSTSKLEHVPLFTTKSIRDIAGGNEVLAVLMKDGSLLTCGLNKSGQCGNGTFEERVLVATPVRALSGIPIDMIAAANGCEHMLAVASDGSVYSWGYNDRGQLGLGSTISKSHTPRLIESLREKYAITSAAVSYHHSAVVTSAGELLTFGMNDCGQLGLDHTQHQHTPQLVDALSSQIVVKVACGLYHTVIITAGGELYSCGKNDYGQLGLGHARNVKIPTLVRVSIGDSDEKIVDISCGYYHTVAITDKGKLVTWGRNDYGQLGIGSKDHKNSPQYVPLPLSSKIRKSSCGCYHTLILLANGRVMVFGRNNKGQLGAGARTLPSADLPLPIPLNTLSQDEATCIAAGFYSSYILTGRPSQLRDGDRFKDEQAQAKEMAEHNSSEVLYESLMKEIDRNQPIDVLMRVTPIHIKRGNMNKKLPLLKLHAASWALMRALLFLSLEDRSYGLHRGLASTATKKYDGVVDTLIGFLLENMRELQGLPGHGSVKGPESREVLCVTLKNACVGLLSLCVSRPQLDNMMWREPSFPVDVLYPHFFRNQVLWVLLTCGSSNTELCSVLASNHDVVAEVLKGIASSDLSTATICIRLAMLIFPLHSVSYMNNSYRNAQSSIPSNSSCIDLLSMLLVLIGTPLVLRPRLCNHELGIERACSSLCESSKCLKGLNSVEDGSCASLKDDVLEQSHVATAKASEVTALLRYLTVYPAWKVAINAAISKSFDRIDKLSDILDTVCFYYVSIENKTAETVVVQVETEQSNDTAAEQSALREPETTNVSPEVDDSPSPDSDVDTSKDQTNSSHCLQDKKALQIWQKAKEALDALAAIFASVAVVGGHVECIREGGFAVVEDPENKFHGKSGILSGIKKDSRGDYVARIHLIDSDTSPVWPLSKHGVSSTGDVSIKRLKATERVPSLSHMFESVDNVIAALSVLMLPVTEDSSLHTELVQPQNNSVQAILGQRMRMYTRQIQWRATKALSTLLSQMPRLSPAVINVDTQLLSNVAQTIASEEALKNSIVFGNFVCDGRSASANVVDVLHARWISIKQRQVLLETEGIVDDALDRYEAITREEVVSKLGKQNALSWGPDAIQSPRKGVSPQLFNGRSSAGQASTNLRAERSRADGARALGSTLPHGVWGILHPLPQLNESENGSSSSQPPPIDYNPFHLTTPIVRVGRAADSCDLIVNDRSVSGRHFHLRRARRDNEGGTEEFYELQDFSKNGTIVNGVRVHGTSVRVTPGSRISLILSRGGLVTYEFQVRQPHSFGNGASSGMGRMAPPPIITASQSEVAVSVQGQEYQQPLSAVGSAPVEPRSPAEIQNRGSRQQSMESRMDALRSRIPAAQGLRLITSIAESEVPRALISPNPAVESPRVGGFGSPRSSILQAPGTPAVSTPTASMLGNLTPNAVLSPASYQQRESSSPDSLRPPEPPSSEALRIALGRESISRDGSHRTSWSANPPEPPRLKTFSALSDAASAQSGSAAMELLVRLREVGLTQVSIERCEEAIHTMNGDAHSAFTVLHEQLSAEQAHQREDLQSPTVQHLSNLLAATPTVCAEALRRTQQNVAAATRLLLSSARSEIESSVASSLRSKRFPVESGFWSGDNDGLEQAPSVTDSMINLQEMMEENPCYALADSSAVQQPPRLRSSSPVKNKTNASTAAAKTLLALWAECANQVDEGIPAMTSSEIDEEEATLCGLLTAVHSRKLLQQIARLFSDVPEQADNMLAAFGDPITLRQLILFPPAESKTASSWMTNAQVKDDECLSNGTIQRVLSRTTQECLSAAPTSTLEANIHTMQKLSTLCLTIERDNRWSRQDKGGILPHLLRTLLEYEAHALKADDSGLLQQTNVMHNLVVDTLLHTLSRTFVHNGSLLNWEAAMSKSRRPEVMLPKGPLRLSCGVECVVVTTYDRVWSVPSPDPLLQFRHKWRKRDMSSLSRNESWRTSTPDCYVTIWRPVLPSGVAVPQPSSWFAIGDVLQVGGDAPDRPVLMLRDDGSGLLAPPIGFERVDVTGKGLPRNSDNDSDLQRKQIRSVWWPTAPPGYVAFGCVAGSKEDPFQPPAVCTVRCIREDLVQRAESYKCMWRAETRSCGPPTLLKALDQSILDSRRNQHAENVSVLELASDEMRIQTSLWVIEADFSRTILPAVTVDGAQTDPMAGFTINMSLEDKILCAPVTVHDAMSFINTLLHCEDSSVPRRSALGDDKVSSFTAIRPELSSALFALIKQVLAEKLPGSGQPALSLVRTLIRLIQRGATWRDKNGLLFCRSRILTLQQDTDGGLMMHSLLQAFVELMLVVDEQNRPERVAELTSCIDKEAKSTIHLPYRFGFARGDSHKEMLVSHSSKMAVTRHFSGEERKFLLEYHVDESANASTTLPETPLECYSCRFEHTPELMMTLKNELKAEIVYFEITVLEWNNSVVGSPGLFGFGISPPEFPLEGPGVGMNSSGANSYAFTPVSGKVHSCDLGADHWRWNEQITAVAIGDVYGCGLRIDTREVFFTKNGRLLGTAFSSLPNVRNLHPTVSVSGDCKFLINFGSSDTTGDVVGGKVNFAYRFNTMNYDNIMSGFEWYEQLGQVYGVIQALMDPSRSDPGPSQNPPAAALLPDEFMLSADNFLSEISQDVCIRVESAHPYDLDLQEALVNIPLATSIRVKLDAQCETANSHCLQILQGGDYADSTSSSSESEVRAFTGTCGGQEVMIDGDSFVWRFPVQSNFQCRVDRIRKGPYLKLENRDTRLSLTRDKGWQTAIGMARFDSGIHIWEVRITFVTASSNIFLGIARRDVRLDSYLGKDNRGWGWIGNRALWHNGSKQRGTYGEKFKTGDVVRMTLDLKRGTLSYALNGKDLGVAFGPGGVGPKLEGTFYPGFALYNQRDSIDLIAGHRVEDGDAMLSTGSGVGGLLPGAIGDDVYYSEDDEDGMGEIDDGIPNFRMELATALSQMGFPMDWCVYALRHCEDDAEQAADFILANMHVMEALVREETEAQSRRLRQREALVAAAAAGALSGVSATGASTGASSLTEATAVSDTNAAGESLDGIENAVAGAVRLPSGVDEVGGTAAGENATPQNVDKWGIAFTAVPEFSVTGRRLLAFKYSSKLEQLHHSQMVFTTDHDNAIVQIVNEVCESRAEALLSCDPLRMTPEEFVPTEEHLRRFQCLNGIPLAQLQKRFLILRNFNCRLQNSLSYIDFSVDDEQSLLARGARMLRGVIFQNVKLAWWLSILKEQQSPAAARPEIEIDRHRAREATELSGPRESVFAQCFEQLHSIQPSLLRGADRAFKCQFVGEFGDDFGGLYRECLAQMSSELQSNVLPLLIPCPNALTAVGDNRDKFVPNVHIRSDARLVQMAEFLGKLIGIAIRTKTPLDLNLPAMFWKTLVGQVVARHDVESIHEGSFQVVDAIDNIKVHGITESMFDEIIDAHFSVISSARLLVDIVPGGQHVRVLWEDKDDYARAVQQYRLNEFLPLCQDIIRGVATILPAPTISLFTWREFATLVCGKPTVDIELLRRRTIYGDGCQATDPHIAYFWDVLSEFTDEQKSSFLRFVWGRSRLPTHAADFTQDFKISGLPKAAGRPDAYLPIAHTCFFSIDLPNYTCREVMRERLLYAITHCLSIDADNTTVAQRAGQGLNWTATATAGSNTLAAPAFSTATATATSTAVATAAAAVSSVIAGLSAALAE